MTLKTVILTSKSGIPTITASGHSWSYKTSFIIKVEIAMPSPTLKISLPYYASINIHGMTWGKIHHWTLTLSITDMQNVFPVRLSLLLLQSITSAMSCWSVNVTIHDKIMFKLIVHTKYNGGNRTHVYCCDLNAASQYKTADNIQRT